MALSWRVPVLLLAGIGFVLARPAASTAWLVVLAVLVLMAIDLARAGRPDALVVERSQPGQCRVGESSTAGLVVTNTGRRRVVGLLRDAWQPSAGARGNRHQLALPPGGTARLTTSLHPTRRGVLWTDRITVRSFGPLGLAARQHSVDAADDGRLRVNPAFPSLRLLPSRLARLREIDGRAAVRVRGQGTEFDSLREYVRGDDVRSIDWRATARTRNVVVRTWQPERDRRVVLVLDTSRTSAGRIGDVPRLDAAMDAALLMGALAARAGDRVDFVAGDNQVRARVRTGHQGEALPALQDAMVPLKSTLVEADWRRLIGAVDALGRNRALVIILTALEPATLEPGLLPVLADLQARHRVLLAAVRDPELDELVGARSDLSEVYRAAAAERELAERSRGAQLLRALGVEVIDEAAEDYPGAIADRYLALKAQGLL